MSRRHEATGEPAGEDFIPRLERSATGIRRTPKKAGDQSSEAADSRHTGEPTLTLSIPEMALGWGSSLMQNETLFLIFDGA